MKSIHILLVILMLVYGFLVDVNLITEQGFNFLSYNRLEIEHGEIWRLVTCHFIHLNLPHLFLNLSAFCLLLCIFWSNLNFKTDCISLLFCITVIDIGLFFSSDLKLYVGFSGVLHGLFCYYLFKILVEVRLFSLVGLLIIITKICWEQSYLYDSSALSHLIGGRVATEAHLYGGIAGLICGICCHIKTFMVCIRQYFLPVSN